MTMTRLLILAFIMFSPASLLADELPKPNIIFIFADD